MLELRGCSCPAAPAWGWGCACAGKRKVLGLLEALQAANCDQSCVALMPTKQETQPESRIPDRQEIGSYCGCLKLFFPPLVVFFCCCYLTFLVCGHVYSSCVASMLIAGKLTGIPLGNPSLQGSWCACPFPPFLFAFKLLTCAAFYWGKERIPLLVMKI